MAATERKIIVGIDYGTTKTRVTYALWDPADQAANQITVMKFNGRESTPSKLAFDADGQVLWGHAAQDVATGYTWSKVLLDPQQNHGGYRGRLLSHLVEDGFLRLDPRHNRQRVIGQFLRCLRDEVVTKLKLLYPEKPPVEWWFSIPAVWGEQPRHRMLQVVTAAGYKSDPRDAVFLISEAEAAAIATLYRIPRFQFTREFRFLVCDCGGGTSDVTVLSVQDRGSGPQYTQITASTGIRSGGAEVDCQLLKLLEARQDEVFTIAMQDRNEVAKVIDRVSRVKFNFTGFEPRILQLSPGQVMLSPADIHGALGPIVDQIVELVQGAINASGRDQQPLNLQAVFLEGGFGKSPYLRAKLSESVCSFSTLEPPMEYWEHLVARGATLRGLETARFSGALCCQHFGLQSVRRPDFGAPDSMIWYDPLWILRKNEALKQDHRGTVEIVLVHHDNESLAKTVTVISDSRDGAPPETMDQSIHMMGVITCRLRQETLQYMVHHSVNGVMRYFPTVTVRWLVVTLDGGRKAVNFKVISFAELIGEVTVPIPL